MVEGGRLEIVLAVLSCHVGSNPTSSATRGFKSLYFMRRVVRVVYGERLEAVCGDEPPEVQILYSPPFYSECP